MCTLNNHLRKTQFDETYAKLDSELNCGNISHRMPEGKVFPMTKPINVPCS